MLGALVKAFTGRAGILASLLALLIVVVIALAVILGVPRIEQKLVGNSQDLLKESLAESDVLTQLEAKGRDLYIEGSIQDVAEIETKLAALEGVRHVNIVNTGVAENAGGEAATSMESKSNESSVSQEDLSASEGSAVEMAEALDQDVAESEPLAAASDVVPVESNITEETVSSEKLDQSSLSLRYDGTELVLSGHVADAQMMELIQAEIEKTIPQGSTLITELDGQGAVSSLVWMDEFLNLVAGLPNDAQGLILGSDQKGVYIEPDAEQTLIQGDSSQGANAQMQLDQSVAEMAAAVSNDDASVEEDITIESSDVVENVEQVNTAEHQSAVQPELQADAQSDQATQEVVVESGADSAAGSHEEGSAEQQTEDTGAVAISEQANSEQNDAAESAISEGLSPAEFILSLNKHLATQNVYGSGEIEISDTFALKLDQLADIMYHNPSLLLRVVGNIDFSVDPRDAEYIGIDRAREIRDYMRVQGVEPFRVFAAPLPTEYAYDERIQVVFYISE